MNLDDHQEVSFESEKLQKNKQFHNNNKNNNRQIVMDEDEESNEMKLRINSNLIKSSTSILPDELKTLGVNAFNENDFENGVLHQFNIQLATYELNKAKKQQQENCNNKKITTLPKTRKRKTDDFKSNENEIENNQNENVDDDVNEIPMNNTAEYLSKKAKLDAVLSDYNSYSSINKHENSQFSRSSSLYSSYSTKSNRKDDSTQHKLGK
jgi:hypothetical protein